MCDFLCVAITADVDPKPRLERVGLYPEECTDSPVGRAVMTEGKRQRAYFITDHHCSCGLFPSEEDLRRPSRRHRLLPRRDGLLAWIRELVEEQHSVPLLRHCMSGNAWEEEVTPQRKVKLPLAELVLQLEILGKKAPEERSNAQRKSGDRARCGDGDAVGARAGRVRDAM